MLEVRNINISNNIHDKNLIKDLSFTLNKNDKLCIIGEEGTGKTTLLKYIYDENLVDTSFIKSGIIVKNNLRLGYLEQFMDTQYNDFSVLDYIMTEDIDIGVNYDRFSEIKDIYVIFNMLNIDTSYIENDKKIYTLSGGQKVKVQLAKMLFSNPDILLLDEPTNDIDISTLEWLENYMNNCGLPIIFISHDEVLLENVSNCVLHFERDNNLNFKYTYEHIGYKEYVTKRLYNINRQNSIAENENKLFDKKQKRFDRILQRVDHELNTISRQNPSGGRLLKKKMKSVKSLEKRLDTEKDNLTQKINLPEDINTSFHNVKSIYNKKVIIDLYVNDLSIGDKVLVHEVKLKVVGAEKICITGENGIGKTTLLKKICEQLKNSNTSFCYMPQNYLDMFDENITPIEYLTFLHTKEELTDIMTYLSSLNFTHYNIYQEIKYLSGGQKAKLYIAKLILNKTDVLILDEPTRNLSPLSSKVLREALKSYSGAIISVSHDRKYINEVCDKIYILSKKGLQLI